MRLKYWHFTELLQRAVTTSDSSAMSRPSEYLSTDQAFNQISVD